MTPENHLSPAKHPSNPDKERKAVNVTIAVESIEEALESIKHAGGAEYQ